MPSRKKIISGRRAAFDHTKILEAVSEALQKLVIVFSRSRVSGIGYYDHSSLENICSLMIKAMSIIGMVRARGKIRLSHVWIGLF